MIVLSILGEDRLTERLEAMAGGIEGGLARRLTKLSLELRSAIQAKLGGPVLNPRSGALRDSISATVSIDGSAIAAKAGSDLPYAAIHEFGGTTGAHDIRARKAQALAFMLGGKQVFARQVHHPGSRIPERSFLRSALDEMKPQILAEMRQAVLEGGGP